MKPLNIIVIFALILFSNTTLADSKTPLWSITDLQEPESMLVDKDTGLAYISNMNGPPTDNNGQGYISLVSADGKIIKKDWVTGLGAPKGMALHDNYLYVADLQTLHVIDHTLGKVIASVKADGSNMLNDIAVDDNGTVYISDLIAGGLFRYFEGQLTPWIDANEIPHPNGLLYQNEKLIMATWGLGMQADFSTTTLGGLYEINIEDKSITPLSGAQEIGNLDGIAVINGTIFVNDWMNGNVFSYKENQAKLLFNAGKNASDISSNGNHLLVPMMFSKRVDAYLID